MTGPKLNEATRVAGVSSGTRAKAMNVRMSASKVRVVLNHIRGVDVRSADNTLALMQRDAAHDVRKLLASAVANAVNNDSKDADTLFVKACFADEGPTMKRFRPRAKGRAGAIFKRTCHITIVVDTLDDDALKIVQARRDRAIAGRRAARGGGVADRRARVAKSREARSESAEAAESTAVESGEATAAPETTNTPDSAEENS